MYWKTQWLYSASKELLKLYINTLTTFSEFDIIYKIRYFQIKKYNGYNNWAEQ